MHYAATEDHDGESNSTDTELPFKSHDNCISSNSCIGTPASFESFSFDPLSVIQKKYPHPFRGIYCVLIPFKHLAAATIELIIVVSNMYNTLGISHGNIAHYLLVRKVNF